MQVQQYIYTRLSAAQSPHKSTGFQSAFMPEGLMGKLQSVSLEAHVHYPDAVGLVEKRVVFWVEIERQHWQVILFVSSLPEARDEFDRAGIFLAQGFLFPPEIWTRYRNPLRLAPLCDDHRFKHIDDILASPLVDRKKGTIAGIDPGVFPIDDPEGNAPPADDTERAALALLYRIADGTSKQSALVYKGNARAAEQFFARMFSFLPSALKVRMAWDSAFDGGKLFFAPCNVVAYSLNPPVTGYQAIYQPSQHRIEYSDSDQAELVRPFDPFSRWLAHCLDASLPPQQVDAVYEVSRVLRGLLPYSSGAISPCYARVNEEAIRLWLQDATDPMLPPAWRAPIAKHLRSNEIQAVALAAFEDKALAVAVAKAILHGQLLPANFKTPPPPRLVATREPRLKVLATMWSREAIDKNALLDIVVEEREQILVLLAKNGLRKEEAAALGFTAEEIKFAEPHFLGGLGRMMKRLWGR